MRWEAPDFAVCGNAVDVSWIVHGMKARRILTEDALAEEDEAEEDEPAELPEVVCEDEPVLDPDEEEPDDEEPDDAADDVEDEAVMLKLPDWASCHLSGIRRD